MIDLRRHPLVSRTICTLRGFRHGLFRERRARFLSYGQALDAFAKANTVDELNAVRARISVYAIAACPGVPAAYSEAQTHHLSNYAAVRTMELATS